MVDFAMIGGLTNSLNVALNISKAMLSIRDQAIIQEKIIELTSHIITAQQDAVSAIATQAALSERVRDLEQKIAEMERWDTEKERYGLQAIDATFFCYAMKPEAAAGQPPHWLCAACYGNGKKSILSVTAETGGKNVWQCPVCSTKHMLFRHRSPSAPT